MRLLEASDADIDTITRLLVKMAEDGGEVSPSTTVIRANVASVFDGPRTVFYFLYLDDEGIPIGTCHCQSVHNYWRTGKRFYVGGVFVDPAYRRQGHFKEMMSQLQAWCTERQGVQLYGHVSRENENSRQAFSKVGYKILDYDYFYNQWGSDD